ncbi:unnamed protein product [Effrenium voratum]|uniref:JmjC domain-containing protein n=1 Tax=Effrenium voratum TaxID=2562239 RepID=A0AA36JM84_9DINO|nr:unnamed protein product [Effrenium voratum]
MAAAAVAQPEGASGYAALPQRPAEDWVCHVNSAKRKIRSELSLEDWQKYGFGHRRAAEFEALADLGGLPRERWEELSVEEFWDKYEKPGQPCFIAGVPAKEGWPRERWSWESFFKRYGKSSFKVGKDDRGGSVRLRADHFERYAQQQQDDSPVYLFDNQFKHEKKAILDDYRVPSYFPDDYMGLCGDDRPPYRWVGVGPKRSGTIMHQDPLCTSAWNTLLVGRKLWLLLPPETPKKVAKAKDVMLPEDDDEACNHFLDLLPRKRARQDPDFKPLVCVQHAGETIYVPGNWWHCVVNLDDTIAVTQNYVGRNNFPQVWRSCRTERPCWSQRWLRAMDRQCPELAAWARRLNAEDGFDMNELRQKNSHFDRAAAPAAPAAAPAPRAAAGEAPGPSAGRAGLVGSMAAGGGGDQLRLHCKHHEQQF